MDRPARPLPEIDDHNRPFWEGLARHALVLQRCAACGHVRYPINEVCPRCLSSEHTWEPMSGRGTVYSTIVFHQVYHPAFADEVPYNVSLVQLAEGPRMISNVVGVPPDEVRVGDELEIVYADLDEGITINRFRPTGVGS
jgi:uncharacterized protein